MLSRVGVSPALMDQPVVWPEDTILCEQGRMAHPVCRNSKSHELTEKIWTNTEGSRTQSVEYSLGRKAHLVHSNGKNDGVIWANMA